MRFVPAGLASLIAAGFVLASTADARAQASCSNFAVPNGGYNGYVVGNNQCKPLTGVTATLEVTQDIVVDTSTCSNNSFSFQLNANGPAAGLTASQLTWQQFVIEVNADGQSVEGFTQIWPLSTPTGTGPGQVWITNNPQSMGQPKGLPTIPAGAVFKWALQTDSAGNVDSVKYSAYDQIGTAYTSVTEYIPQGSPTPIVSLNFDIVGSGSPAGCQTTFRSGAGYIIITANEAFTNPYSSPTCAQNSLTAEDSNSVYELYTTGWDTTVQEAFFTSTTGGFRNGNCGYPGTYPNSLGDWAYGDYKAECPAGAPMYGVSRVPGQLWSDAVECGGVLPEYNLYGIGCYARPVENWSNQGDTDRGWDWDPGSYKTECAASEYVAGISQASGNGALTSILCCPAWVNHDSCNSQEFYNGNSPGYVAPDWDYGNYKGQCPAGQYVAGISTPAFPSIGTTGAAHAILCCSP
jgi:hypothetical protein